MSFYRVSDSIDPNSTNIQPKQGGGDSGDDSSSDLEALIGEITDITAHDISTLNNGLKGLPLAILMCDRLQKNTEFALKQASIEGKLNEALLNNDFEEYKKQQQEKIKQIVAQEKQSQQDFEKKLAPLKIRNANEIFSRCNRPKPSKKRQYRIL